MAIPTQPGCTLPIGQMPSGVTSVSCQAGDLVGAPHIPRFRTGAVQVEIAPCWMEGSETNLWTERSTAWTVALASTTSGVPLNVVASLGLVGVVRATADLGGQRACVVVKVGALKPRRRVGDAVRPGHRVLTLGDAGHVRDRSPRSPGGSAPADVPDDVRVHPRCKTGGQAGVDRLDQHGCQKMVPATPARGRGSAGPAPGYFLRQSRGARPAAEELACPPGSSPAGP